MESIKFKLSLLSLALIVNLPCTYAASPIDISHKGITYLQNYLVKPGFTGSNKSAILEKQRGIDFNHTLHMRAQQTYAGYPVWGGNIAVHAPQTTTAEKGFAGFMAKANKPNTTMNGMLYQDLDKDLHPTPAYVFEDAQAKKALDQAINLSQHAIGADFKVEEHKQQLMVYVDDNHKAHWAFYISLYGKQQGFPTIPSYILDAVSLTIYKQWNDMKHSGLSHVKGGGYGGNFKMGKLVYDGDFAKQHLAALDMERDNKKQECYLKNKDVSIYNFKQIDAEHFKGKLASFTCIKPDEKHNNLYWNGEYNFVNGGYSPNNDALYAGKVVRDLYESWYQIPVLSRYEAPMPIVMIMHTTFSPFPEQAIWDSWNQIMFFGDGKNFFYPLTSIDVTAHEISHGFTDQHSQLFYGDSESGGLNEAFSDMAGQAAQYFLRGKNDWKIGAEITKQNSIALRYMDRPSKDCYGNLEPGRRCSVENMDEYAKYVKEHKNDITFDFTELKLVDHRKPDVHFSSGIYNYFFYLVATSEGWDVKKAFDVMVQANRFYWVENTNFEQAACGIIKAAKDYQYDETAITKAFAKVIVDISNC